MSSIPFTLPDAGLREVSGTLYLEEDLIVLEIETTLFGEWDPENKVVEIEPGALVEVRFQSGLLKDKFILRPRKRELLSVVPGTHKEELVLKIKKRYRDETLAMVDVIEEWIATDA